MLSPKSNDDYAELAALFLAGAMSDDQARAFEARLDSGDPDCLAELLELRGTVEALIESVEPVTPNPEVKRELLDRMDRDQDLYVQRDTKDQWQLLDIPGARVRNLFVDPASGNRTFLMKLEPGAAIPVHAHKGAEECYVIEGDLHTYDTILRPGDYLRAPAGSEHSESYTESGCLLLITSAAG